MLIFLSCWESHDEVQEASVSVQRPQPAPSNSTSWNCWHSREFLEGHGGSDPNVQTLQTKKSSHLLAIMNHHQPLSCQPEATNQPSWRTTTVGPGFFTACSESLLGGSGHHVIWSLRRLYQPPTVVRYQSNHEAITMRQYCLEKICCNHEAITYNQVFNQHHILGQH